MEPFIATFSAIDKRGINVITINELRNYVAENHLDTEMILKWQVLFDPEGSGKITFRKFCEVLGVHPERNQYVVKKPLYGYLHEIGLRPEILVIMQELPLQEQIKISEEAYRLTQPYEKFVEKETSEKLKKWLDMTYGRHWHVTIVKGSYWTTYTHAPNWSFHFKINQHSFIIYRTNE
ncbi:Tegument antigen [Schistosoma japonicum]|uniref:Tegument antigen n=1 Tax=Schistosoma japonicum TaxID=6182 RepID=A0A4Z2CTB8_SCHJA|nr:Tegument antigen [Schistosoma japonicum]